MIIWPVKKKVNKKQIKYDYVAKLIGLFKIGQFFCVNGSFKRHNNDGSTCWVKTRKEIEIRIIQVVVIWGHVTQIRVVNIEVVTF